MASSGSDGAYSLSANAIVLTRALKADNNSRFFSANTTRSEFTCLIDFDIVNNGWHIYLKDICTYATLSKVS